MSTRLLHFFAGLFFLFLSFAGSKAFGQGGVITTFAGGGTATGSGVPATSAHIVQTGGVTVDAMGNVYFTDTFRVIKKIDAVTGAVSTIAGMMTGGWSGYTGDGGPATAAEITANWLCTDAAGNIYMSGVNRVRKVDIATGIITTVAGNGTYTTSGDGGPATAAGLPFAEGIWVDGANNLYVCADKRVRKIDGLTGVITTVAGNGSSTFSGDGGPATAAGVDATGICMNAAGELLITGRNHHRVRSVSTTGIITTIAGTGVGAASGDGGPATAAGVDAPYGIAVDVAGNIYLSFYWASGVRRIDAATGTISTVIGGTGSTSVSGTGALCTEVRPEQLASDPAGSIYGAIDFHTIFKAVVTPTAFSSAIATFNDYTSCASSGFWVTTTAGGPSLSLQTYFGDGTDAVFPMTSSTCPVTPGFAYAFHNYAVGGTYTVKHVLINAGVRVDSVTFSHTYSLCREARVSLYLDTNSNCVRDPFEHLNIGPVAVEVDSVGMPVDTVVTLGGLYYDMYGASGDVYDFKVIAHHPLFTPSCPASGVVSDTVIGATSPREKVIGFDCGGTGTDMAIRVSSRSWWYKGKVYAWVRNYSCDTVSPVVGVDFDPRYVYSSSVPAPLSVSAGTASFHLPPISAKSGYPAVVVISLDTVSALPVGDTVNTRGFAGPLAADVDTFNNRDSYTAWVSGAYDPNQISVYPGPCITSAPTELEYTVQFENLGNDTAYNIHVMDTLASELDFSSFRLDFSSVNNVVVKEINAGGLHIVKFDFPGIKLPDSSSDQNKSMFVYKIKTRAGLADGTNIPARVGIYFDVNPVVMTNTATNIVNCPTAGVRVVDKETKLLIYPNPATDKLTIRVSDAVFTSVSITNAMGQEMIRKAMNGSELSVDVRALPAGVYQVTLRGTGGSEVRKFVKW